MPMPDFSLLYSFPYLAVLFMLFILWRCDQGRVRICYLLPRNICENVALFILLIFLNKKNILFAFLNNIFFLVNNKIIKP